MLTSEVHQHVLDLAAELTNATLADDVRETWRLHSMLVSYCSAVAREGRDHAFLWETVGDFTTNDHQAVEYYLRALALSVRDGEAEYEASICLQLARRYVELADAESARIYARRADNIARQLDDLELRLNISEFLVGL